MKKIIPFVIALLVCISLFVYNNQKETVLYLAMMTGSNWDVPEYDSFTMIDEAISKFEDAHPGVHVVYETGITPDNYEEYIARKILKNEPLDILYIPSNMLNTLYDAKALEPLNNYIIRYNLNTEAYYPACLEAGMVDNVIYALPYESVPRVMFVNKTLLENEGIDIPSSDWTWDDFLKIAKAVTRDKNNDNIIDQFGFYGYTFEDAYISNDATLYDEKSNTVNINNNIVSAAEYLRNLYHLHDERLTSDMFDKGYVAFCPMDYSDYRTYMPYPWRVKKYSGFKWDCLTMPKGPDGNNTSIIDTLSLGILSDSKHKDLAFEFITSLSYDVTYQTKLVTLSQGVSVLREVMCADEVISALNEDTPGDSIFDISILNDIMNHGVAIRYSHEYEQVMQLINSQVDELIYNDSDIENALIRLQLETNAYLLK